VNFPLDALAHLGLARANAISGDTAKAKTAYQDFLAALWKDADPDIPVLKPRQSTRSCNSLKKSCPVACCLPMTVEDDFIDPSAAPSKFSKFSAARVPS
jgi:hypothetical protein